MTRKTSKTRIKRRATVALLVLATSPVILPLLLLSNYTDARATRTPLPAVEDRPVRRTERESDKPRQENGPDARMSFSETHDFPEIPYGPKLLGKSSTTLTVLLPETRLAEGNNLWREVRIRALPLPAPASAPQAEDTEGGEPYIKPRGERKKRSDDNDHVTTKRHADWFPKSAQNSSDDIAIWMTGNNITATLPLLQSYRLAARDADDVGSRESESHHEDTILSAAESDQSATPAVSERRPNETTTSRDCVTCQGQDRIKRQADTASNVTLTTENATSTHGITTMRNIISTPPQQGPRVNNGTGTPPGILVGREDTGVERQFTIGDHKQMGGVPNPPLQPDTEYEVLMVILRERDGETVFVWLSVTGRTLPVAAPFVLSPWYWNLLLIALCILCLAVMLLALYLLCKTISCKRGGKKKVLSVPPSPVSPAVSRPPTPQTPQIPVKPLVFSIKPPSIHDEEYDDDDDEDEGEDTDDDVSLIGDPSFPDYLRKIHGPERHWNPIYDVTSKRHLMAKRENIRGYGRDTPTNFPSRTMTTSHLDISDTRIRSEQRSPPQRPPLSFRDEFYMMSDSGRDRSLNNPYLAGFCGPGHVWNRFPHIPFLAETRVDLQPDGSSSSNRYIHANFISGYSSIQSGEAAPGAAATRAACPQADVTYIAAASPFNPGTALDFWRMIHQHGVETVVMLTNVVEDGVVKCAQYWPCCGQTVRTLGHFLLQTVEEKLFADYAVRTIKFRTNCERCCGQITQFHFTSWPRQGVPTSAVPWLELRRKVRIHHGQKSSPILVHCGTGVSRTACFIAVDITIEQYEAEGEVSVFDTVQRMRSERPMMIRSAEQYRFIYACLQEDFEAGDTGVRLAEGLFSIRAGMEEVNPLTGRTWMYDQFDLLNHFTVDILSTDLGVIRELDGRAVHPYGRYPQDYMRPEVNALQPYALLNPVFVNGLRQENAFALLQTPLDTESIYEFWQFVDKFDVITIVNLGNPQESRAEINDKGARKRSQKRSRPGKRKQYSETDDTFRAETVSLSKYDGIFVRVLRLEKGQMVGGKRKLSMRKIRHFSVPYETLLCSADAEPMLTGGRSSSKTNGIETLVTGGRSSSKTNGIETLVTGGRSRSKTNGSETLVTGGRSRSKTNEIEELDTGGRSRSKTNGIETLVTGGRSRSKTNGSETLVTGGRSRSKTNGIEELDTGGRSRSKTNGIEELVTGGRSRSKTNGSETLVTGGRSRSKTNGIEELDTGGRSRSKTNGIEELVTGGRSRSKTNGSETLVTGGRSRSKTNEIEKLPSSPQEIETHGGDSSSKRSSSRSKSNSSIDISSTGTNKTAGSDQAVGFSENDNNNSDCGKDAKSLSTNANNKGENVSNSYVERNGKTNNCSNRCVDNESRNRSMSSLNKKRKMRSTASLDQHSETPSMSTSTNSGGIVTERQQGRYRVTSEGFRPINRGQRQTPVGVQGDPRRFHSDSKLVVSTTTRWRGDRCPEDQDCDCVTPKKDSAKKAKTLVRRFALRNPRSVGFHRRRSLKTLRRKWNSHRSFSVVRKKVYARRKRNYPYCPFRRGRGSYDVRKPDAHLVLSPVKPSTRTSYLGPLGSMTTPAASVSNYSSARQLSPPSSEESLTTVAGYSTIGVSDGSDDLIGQGHSPFGHPPSPPTSGSGETAASFTSLSFDRESRSPARFKSATINQQEYRVGAEENSPMADTSSPATGSERTEARCCRDSNVNSSQAEENAQNQAEEIKRKRSRSGDFRLMSPGKILELLEVALDWQATPLRDWYRTDPKVGPAPRPRPILIHAPRGSGAASLLCACALVCERAQEENAVDIYHVVKDLRRKQPKAIENFAQYEMIWNVLCNYVTDYQDIVHHSDRWRFRGVRDKTIWCPAIECETGDEPPLSSGHQKPGVKKPNRSNNRAGPPTAAAAATQPQSNRHLFYHQTKTATGLTDSRSQSPGFDDVTYDIRDCVTFVNETQNC